MNKKPFSDRGLLIPIGIGVFSIAGIFIALLLGNLNDSRVDDSETRTATPFKYALLATETQSPTLGSETDTPEATFPEETISIIPITTPEEEFLIVSATTPSQINTLVINNSFPSTATATATPTFGEALPLTVGKYDEADLSIVYSSGWTIQTNVESVYLGTRHVSNATGNDVSFSFVGQRMHLGYQRVFGSGTILITIDDEQFTLAQTAGNIWISPQLDNNEHFVVIIHETGDSVNLDYISIFD